MNLTANDLNQAASFANHILTDWDSAMDIFFRRVETKQRAKGLTDAQVAAALDIGYGESVTDCWTEWNEDD
jgi:hypothetical protein